MNSNKNKFKIKYVDKAIANRYEGRRIELNKKLLNKEYAPLRKEIIEHEKAHTDKGYNLKDLKLDLRGIKNKRLYIKFLISTPTAWYQFFPVYKFEGKWYWDISVTLLWFYTILIIGITFGIITGRIR